MVNSVCNWRPQMQGAPRKGRPAPKVSSPPREAGREGRREATQEVSFNILRSTLPAPVAGNASMKRTSRGAL